MQKNVWIVLFLVMSSPFLSSCWDITEIEEIGFLMAVGMDPVPQEEEKLKEYEKERNKKIDRKAEHPQMFNVTYNVAIPSKIEAQEGGRTGRAFFNLTTTGVTNFKTAREIAARTSRRLNFEHLKVIVINEDLVRNSPMLKHLMDLYVRDHEMRRRAYVYITNKKARDALEQKLPLEELVASSILDINDHHPAVNTMIPPTSVGDIATNLIAGKSFLISRIIPNENDLKVKGAAVFTGKENKMTGWIGEEEIKGLNWVTGEVENAIVEVEYEEREGEFFIFEVITAATKIDYKREGGKNIFNVEIRSEGAFSESWLHDLEISEEKTIDKLEQQVEKEIKKQAEQIIDKMQNEFHADIFGFHKKVRQKEYDYWKTVKEEWDGPAGAFKDAEVNVQAKVKIRHYMLNEKLD